jgi:hypothetical protein
MKTFPLATVVKLGLAGLLATSAHAHTSENQLFTCTGELTKTQGNDGKSYYSIVETWLVDNKDNILPMDCYIDEGKVLRQILSVCHVGDLCVASAKGESGNGNRYVIQKVFAIQRQPSSRVQELKRDFKQ